MRARILPAVLLLVPAAAHSGVSATIAEKQRTSTLFVEGSRLRIEDGNRILIFDGDAKRLVTIDPAKHTYGVSTEADMKAMGAKYRPQMEAAEAEMRKRMEKMTPEQRKQMEELLRKSGFQGGQPTEPAKVETRYEPTGAKRTVAGHACQMYRVTQGESPEEQCLLPWSAGVVKKEDLEVFNSFGRFMSQIYVGMGRELPKEVREGVLGDLAHAPGAPLLRLRDGEVVSEVKKLERGTISADKFAVPAGYTKMGQADLGFPKEK